MAQFKYTGLTPDGARVSGVIDGFNELDAASRIRESCSVILKLAEVREKQGLLNLNPLGARLNSKAFTVMCSQFAIILRSGIPIARAVQLICDQTTDKTLHKLLTDVSADVEGGRSVAQSFGDHGEKFLPATFIETIRAGEESGNLDRSFQTMYEHFDKQVKMKASVRRALAYPVFILVLAVVVVIVMMVKVVPTFTGLFAENGGELPAATRLLIAMSDFFTRWWLLLVAIVAAAAIALKVYSATEDGRMRMAKLKLRLPVVGNITRLTAASQFANTMAALLVAGLPLSKTVNITSRVIDNYYLATENGKLSEKLEAGYTLGTSMREQQVMPDILIDMTAVGEETGELAETLETIAAYYDSELEAATRSALAKIEPALLVFIAVVVGFIVFAVYSAMFGMYNNLNM